jgi:hypothetical protein
MASIVGAAIHMRQQAIVTAEASIDFTATPPSPQATTANATAAIGSHA